MHLAMEAARPTKFSLPALDDANSIQVAVDRSIQGLVDGTLEEKRATKLAYFLQLAMSNVGRVFVFRGCDHQPMADVLQESGDRKCKKQFSPRRRGGAEKSRRTERRCTG